MFNSGLNTFVSLSNFSTNEMIVDQRVQILTRLCTQPETTLLMSNFYGYLHIRISFIDFLIVAVVFVLKRDLFVACCSSVVSCRKDRNLFRKFCNLKNSATITLQVVHFFLVKYILYYILHVFDIFVFSQSLDGYHIVHTTQ